MLLFRKGVQKEYTTQTLTQELRLEGKLRIPVKVGQ